VVGLAPTTYRDGRPYIGQAVPGGGHGLTCPAAPPGPAAIYLRAGSIGQYVCPNTCYSSVVAHEYGHFVHSAHGLDFGAFGEGYADTYALLMFDYPLVGADFVGEGTSVRDYTEDCEDYQYPCTAVLPPCGTEGLTQNLIHGCGKLLAGVWWKIKLNIQDTMGELPGLEYARQLFTDWTGITVGGQGLNSAHPQTAIEVLTVDDDDGDLENGTPHYVEICAAFAAHGIECPTIAGDVNGDGSVDVVDLLLLLGTWGPCPPPPDDCPADFDGDGVVGAADLLILLANWGSVAAAGFFTAANLVTRLEEAQKQYQLDRFLSQLDKADLLICDELGYLSFSRTGAELLFQVFADRYERASLLITSNLAFSDWGQVFQGERMTAALLDRLTHRCHVFQMNGESYRFKESVKTRGTTRARRSAKNHSR